MTSSTTSANVPAQQARNQPVALQALTFLDEGQEVTVGRADTDSYAVLPAEGASLLRQLGQGLTPDEAAGWYERTYGERVDIDDFLDGLGELGFLRAPDEAAHPAPPVRWGQLGRMVFSPVGGACLAAVLIASALAMRRSPELVPSYHDLFFTHYMTILELVMFLGQFPLLLLHEAAHALAGRRLGLRTRLSVGRRMYYIVFLTAMDGLVAVPRRKRYLPMLAGMLADLSVLAVLVLVADATRRTDGALSPASSVALAIAYVLVTVLGCVDLQGTARAVLRDRLRRALRRPAPPDQHASPHPRDLAVARWYSWLLLAGWTASIAILITGVIPLTGLVLLTVVDRFGSSGTHSAAALADSIVFVLLNVGQPVILVALVLRERRLRSHPGTLGS